MKLIYIGDPMCSWCWGFAPVLERIGATFTVPIAVRVGGLRPGPYAAPLDDELRSYLRHHWQQVEQRSGQPFAYAALERKDWTYDTELPCRAVVAVRALAPEKTLAFFTRLQHAFYAEAIDITRRESYPELLEPFGIDPVRFGEELAGDANREQTYREFAEVRQLGVQGFPSLLLDDGAQLRWLSHGYQPFEQLAPLLRRLLEPFPSGMP